MKICIIDDNVMMSQAVKRLLVLSDSAYEVKLFNDPSNFIGADFQEWKPDLIITEALMRRMNGLRLIGKVKELFGNDMKFVLLVSTHDLQIVRTALQKGVNVCITRDASEQEILQAVEAAKEGSNYMNKSLQQQMISQIYPRKEEAVYHVSPQEKEVLNRICIGDTPNEIASDMQLSINTVQSYIKNMLQKFNVNRIADLITYATKYGHSEIAQR